jgi:hypothetical protein
MKKIIAKPRFLERDFFVSQIKKSSEHITYEMAEEVVNKMDCYWNDLTFRFFDDVSCEIIDNNTDTQIRPNELTGACYDFYVKKRLELIRTHLQQTA